MYINHIKVLADAELEHIEETDRMSNIQDIAFLIKQLVEEKRNMYEDSDFKDIGSGIDSPYEDEWSDSVGILEMKFIKYWILDLEHIYKADSVHYERK